MLQVMRDEENDLATRLDAAVKAAPYVHKKLAALDHTHSGPDGGSVQAVYLIYDRRGVGKRTGPAGPKRLRRRRLMLSLA